MLFLTHWKLNEQMSVRERNEIARSLTDEGVFPPEGVEVLRWDATPDGWGIVLWETDEYAALNEALSLWRASGTPFFEETTTAPAVPASEGIGQIAATIDRLPVRD